MSCIDSNSLNRILNVNNEYVPASKIVVFVFPIFAQYLMSGGIKTFSESVAGGSKLSSEPKGPGAKLKFGPDSGLKYERCSHSEYFFSKWFIII